MTGDRRMSMPAVVLGPWRAAPARPILRSWTPPPRPSPPTASAGSSKPSRSSGCPPSGPTARHTSSRSGSGGMARRCSCSPSRTPRRCATCGPTHRSCWRSATRRPISTSGSSRAEPSCSTGRRARSCPRATWPSTRRGWAPSVVTPDVYARTYSQVIRIVPADFLAWHGRTTPAAPGSPEHRPCRSMSAARTADGEPMSRRRSRPEPRVVRPERLLPRRSRWPGETLVRGLRGLADWARRAAGAAGRLALTGSAPLSVGDA